MRKSRIGERVNMLLCVDERYEDGKWLLTCKCDCGNTKDINQNWFRQLQSCGCVKAFSGATNHKTHGMSNSKEYYAWKSMKERCTKEDHPAYKNYGGRGVKVCSAWLDSFVKFYEDMGKAPSKEHTLDRIDVDGDYSSENCRWVTMKVQGNNKRNNVLVEMFGQTKTLSEWCEEYDVSVQYIIHRVKKMGMSYEQAFLIPKGLFSKESKSNAGLLE